MRHYCKDLACVPNWSFKQVQITGRSSELQAPPPVDPASYRRLHRSMAQLDYIVGFLILLDDHVPVILSATSNAGTAMFLPCALFCAVSPYLKDLIMRSLRVKSLRNDLLGHFYHVG
jgi:hypothetical protein